MQPFIHSITVSPFMIDVFGLNHRAVVVQALGAFLSSKDLSFDSLSISCLALDLKEDSAKHHVQVKPGETLDLGITAVGVSPMAIEFNVNITRSGQPVADIVYSMLTTKKDQVVPVRTTPFQVLVG